MWGSPLFLLSCLCSGLSMQQSGLSRPRRNFTHAISPKMRPSFTTSLQHYLPPAANKYEALKQWLLDSFSLTDTQRVVQLLHMPGLGDDKPLQLMDRMLTLLGDHQSCFLFLRDIHATVANQHPHDPHPSQNH